MIRTGNERTGNRLLVLPVSAGKEMTEATMAAINADGYAEPAVATTGIKVAGCTQTYVDNRNGQDGAQTVQVARGTFVWNNAGDIEPTDLLKKCYVKDPTTVTLDDTGSSQAGIILAVDPDGVTVDMSQNW